MKLKTALFYKWRFNLRSELIFLGFFILFGISLPILGVLLSKTTETVTSDLLFPSLIFMMIASTIGIGWDFKLFIQCGMSRKNIFLASALSQLLSSFTLAVVLLLLNQLIQQVGQSIFKLNFFGINHYTNGQFLTNWLLLTIILFLANCIGLVAGLVLHRFSGAIRVLIGLGVFAIPLLLTIVIQLLNPLQKSQVSKFLANLFGITSQGFSLLPLVLTLAVIIMILLTLSYLMNRRREIKRVNA